MNIISKDINQSIDVGIMLETIPKVDDDLNKFFSFMRFRLPHRIDMWCVKFLVFLVGKVV